MKKIIVRSFCIDSDIYEVVFRFDEDVGKHIGDYPDFEQCPRYTKNGYLWVNATQDGCENAVHKYYPDEVCLDCGSCVFYTTEKAGDLIGICGNDLKLYEKKN